MSEGGGFEGGLTGDPGEVVPSRGRERQIGHFDAVHARLLAILEPYMGRLVSNPIYGVAAIGWPGGSKHDYFAGTRVGKSYVSFYFMPVYGHPELLESVSPALRTRMQGKACFNFTAVAEGLLTELEGLVARGYERFERDHEGGRLIRPRSTRARGLAPAGKTSRGSSR